jgi:2-polyprenyl-3-methyl-5-hydroxy-6-metoxy-1,4-benzoquinol methylase
MRLRYLRTIEGCVPIGGRDVLDIGCGPGHYSVALAKLGARSVLGIDFADGMVTIARERALAEGVAGLCRFERMDFGDLPSGQHFDYVILMGFMDYVSDPAAVVSKALSLTKGKAFFSFPLDGGLLAWQRKLRYRGRCDLFMYQESDVRRLFDGIEHRVERIARDLFVTAQMQP